MIDINAFRFQKSGQPTPENHNFDKQLVIDLK
jgi:hypothetical protein